MARAKLGDICMYCPQSDDLPRTCEVRKVYPPRQNSGLRYEVLFLDGRGGYFANAAPNELIILEQKGSKR